MRETRRSGNYPCQTILQTLKFQDGIDSNIVIKGITIVKSTANENNCNSFGDSKRHLPANTTRVTNVIKATTIPLIIITVLQSICVKFKLLSETEVTPICQQTNCWPLRVGMCIAVFKDTYNTPGGGGGGVLPYQSGGGVPPELHGAHGEREKSRNVGSPRENY